MTYLNPLLAVGGIALAICSLALCFWLGSHEEFGYSSGTVDALVLIGTFIGTVVGLSGFLRSYQHTGGGRMVSVGAVLVLIAFSTPVVMAGAGVWNVHGCGLLGIIWSVGTGLAGLAQVIRGLIRLWRFGRRTGVT